jgi:hypothetical protein
MMLRLALSRPPRQPQQKTWPHSVTATVPPLPWPVPRGSRHSVHCRSRISAASGVKYVFGSSETIRGAPGDASSDIAACAARPGCLAFHSRNSTGMTSKAARGSYEGRPVVRGAAEICWFSKASSSCVQWRSHSPSPITVAQILGICPHTGRL